MRGTIGVCFLCAQQARVGDLYGVLKREPLPASAQELRRAFYKTIRARLSHGDGRPPCRYLTYSFQILRSTGKFPQVVYGNFRDVF
jgi:hypothetical protein